MSNSAQTFVNAEEVIALHPFTSTIVKEWPSEFPGPSRGFKSQLPLLYRLLSLTTRDDRLGPSLLTITP